MFYFDLSFEKVVAEIALYLGYALICLFDLWSCISIRASVFWLFSLGMRIEKHLTHIAQSLRHCDLLWCLLRSVMICARALSAYFTSLRVEETHQTCIDRCASTTAMASLSWRNWTNYKESCFSDRLVWSGLDASLHRESCYQRLITSVGLEDCF